MASRDPQREQYWRSLLGEWQQSGQTVYAFCKHRDLQKTTFYYWQRKLGFVASKVALAPPAFVPLTVSGEPLVEVVLGPVTLKLPLAASAEQIGRWLAAARIASC